MRQRLNAIKQRLQQVNQQIPLNDLEHILTCFEYDITLEETIQVLGLNAHQTEKSIANITGKNKGNLNDIDLLRRHVGIQKHGNRLILGFLSKNMYPFVLMFVTYCMLWFHRSFFSGFVSDLLIDTGVKNNHGLLNVITSFILLFKTCALCTTIFLVFFLRSAKNRILVFGIIQNTPFVTLYKNTVSFLFSETLVCIWNSNNSMKDVLKIMRTYDLGLEPQWIAFQIDSNLEKGMPLTESLEVPMLSPLLTGLIKTGLYNNNLVDNLMRFNKISEEIMTKNLNGIHRIISFISFIDVLIVVSFYYGMLYQTLRIVEVLQL